jgi:UDP-N-acetylmuramate dehydrogenase
MDVACAGSYFKNPVQPDGERVAAAYLLDHVGAKSLSIGGAEVFSDHANFIINKQGATAQDILLLARELKTRVKQKFGITLEEEVIYLPAKLPES